MRSWNFSEKPLLVFWETTKACLLACRHCRAEAITRPLPNELNDEESRRVVEQVHEFGKPYPIIIFTGGDMLMKRNIYDLVGYAHELGIPTAAAPSVTELLTRETLLELKRRGVSMVSFSLDGMRETHDSIRGVAGTWDATMKAIRTAAEIGLTVQVNTCVMRLNVSELPEVFAAIKRAGASVWEVFYLIKVGKGVGMEELSSAECEEVANFLYDAAMYGLRVRTVEAPFFRRVVKQRGDGASPPNSGLYSLLVNRLRQLCGEPEREPDAPITPTRDGYGILFIGHDGSITPGGFLPIPRGNTRTTTLTKTYRGDRLFQLLKNPDNFKGRCGVCEFREFCGGSRARAYAAYQDPLEEDPACPYKPAASG